MSTMSIKINLRQLKNNVKTLQTKNGDVRCIIIPINENRLMETEKGLYLDLTAYQIKERNPERKETHLLKQSLPKEFYDSLTEEQKKNLPIIGNLIKWGVQESDPQKFTEMRQNQNDLCEF